MRLFPWIINLGPATIRVANRALAWIASSGSLGSTAASAHWGFRLASSVRASKNGEVLLRSLMTLRSCEFPVPLSFPGVALDAIACYVHDTAIELSLDKSIFGCLLQVFQTLLFVHLEPCSINKAHTKIILS